VDFLHARDEVRGSDPPGRSSIGKPVFTIREARITNPYDFDTIASPLTFKGRRAEINEILDSIESGTHTAIFGLQRMGKTSLIEEGLGVCLFNAS
jgi:hypothetical protein